jgi:hypothetical protein
MEIHKLREKGKGISERGNNNAENYWKGERKKERQKQALRGSRRSQRTQKSQ